VPTGGFAPLPLRLGGPPEEGWNAAQQSRVAADLVALARVVPFAHVYWVPGEVTVRHHISQPSISLLDAPSVVIGGVGDVTFTWPDNYVDEYGKHYPVSLTGARATLCSITGVALGVGFADPVIGPIGKTSVQVICTGHAGAAEANCPLWLTVY